MPVTKQWPSGTVNATPTSYQLPLNNELNWLQLSSFLQSLADSAQGTTFQKMRVRTVTATPDTVNATVDCILPINVASAAAINLPAGLEKQVFFIFDASGAAATNNITITPNGAETVRGAASLVLNKNYQGVILAFTGTDWKAFGPFITPGSVTDADFSGVLTTAKGGTGQNSTATFPGSGVVATVPAAGVVKSNGTVLSSSNVDLTSEVTGTLPNGNTTATSANTASAIVARDGSGNFSAGTITASLSGNATTATSATTAGNVTGTVAIANGGSGQTTANAALNAFLPNQATNAGKVLQTDGSNTSWASVLANGSTLLAADGSAATPGIAFNADQDTGFYRIGANNLGFAANGVKVGEFGTTGWTLGDTALAASTFTVDSGNITTFIISGRSSTSSKLQFNINGSRQNSIEVTNTAAFSFKNSAINQTFHISDNGDCTLGYSGSSAATHTFDSGAATILAISARSSQTAILQFKVNGTRQNSIEVNNTAAFSFRNTTSTETFGVSDAGVCTLGTTSGSFAGNVIYGKKDGASVTTGAIGEVLLATAASATNFSTDIANGGFSFAAGTQTNYYLLYASGTAGDAAARLTVTAGVWRIEGGFRYNANANDFSEIQAFVYNSNSAAGASATPYSGIFMIRPDSGTSANSQGGTVYCSLTVNSSSSSEYRLYMLYVGTAANLSVSNCWIKATRIG